MKIKSAAIRYYRDNQQIQGRIEWENGSTTTGNGTRKNSCFLLRPSSIDFGTHMDSLMLRAVREGLTVAVERW